MATAGLELRGITVRYGSAAAVVEAHLEARYGEVTALVGPNGAGKSSLLRTACGMQAPAAGTIRLDGEDVTGWSVRRAVARRVMLLSGGSSTFPRLSVEEALGLAGWARPAGWRKDEAVAGALARHPELARRRHSPGGALSGGEQQLLALARAMLSQPRILLADEPTLGLSRAAAAEVRAQLAQLASSGCAVVVAEPRAARVDEVATTVVTMARGRTTGG